MFNKKLAYSKNILNIHTAQKRNRRPETLAKAHAVQSLPLCASSSHDNIRKYSFQLRGFQLLQEGRSCAPHLNR